MQGVCEKPMKDTSPRNLDINLNINITNIKIRYQSQYQYCRNQNLISIPIPIPRIMKFKLNLKTIPRYLDILWSQADTQKIRASIAHQWHIASNFKPPSLSSLICPWPEFAKDYLKMQILLMHPRYESVAPFSCLLLRRRVSLDPGMTDTFFMCPRSAPNTSGPFTPSSKEPLGFGEWMRTGTRLYPGTRDK